MQTMIERLQVARRRIQAIRKKRLSVYARHSVDIEGYNVLYIDSAIKQTTRVNE